MIFRGTAATYGRGRAVVTATGMQTQMGQVAGMLKHAPDEATPLEKELNHVAKLLAIIVAFIAIVMIGTIAAMRFSWMPAIEAPSRIQVAMSADGQWRRWRNAWPFCRAM
jgi:magnesium-transporting ATPase (P-type)